MELQVIASAFNKTDPTSQEVSLKQHFTAARRIKKEVGTLAFRFSPSSQVDSVETRSRMVFWDVGFREVQNLLATVPSGNWIKKLGLTPAELVLPDKAEVLTGFYVSLRNMPADLACSCLKVRMSYNLEVRHAESRLQPQHQITATQGQDLFKYFSEEQSSSADKFCRSVARHHVPTVEALVEKARALTTEACKCPDIQADF